MITNDNTFLSEASLTEAIERQTHLVSYPHRVKYESFEFPGGFRQSNSIQMNCGRSDCFLPTKDIAYFTLDEK